MLVDAAPLVGYPAPYDLLCAILQDATNEWRLEMNPNLTEHAVVWQPTPGSHSIGALILHMINAEVFWFEQLALGLTPEPDPEMPHLDFDIDAWQWPIPPRKPISWYFALQDRIRLRTLESIKQWPASDTVLEHHGHQVTLRWVLGHVIQHEAYHGGQAVLLSRLWQLSQPVA
jgi:uncharacterized damage-inducible protein DinB